jgi:8-oxo-dGTP diphosphatase
VHYDFVISTVRSAGAPRRGQFVADVGDLALAPATRSYLVEPEPMPAVVGPDESRLRPAPGEVWRRQRFAVYALATDPAGRILLAQINTGYPGAGSWHLPGGGTDIGESADDGLLRELIEETDQRGRIVEPLWLSNRRQPDAMGPEGEPIDWHGVRVVYRVAVDEPTSARVTEGAGSTVAAGWFSRSDALALPLTEVARESITRYLDHAP